MRRLTYIFILCCLAGWVRAETEPVREYVQANGFQKAASVPVRVVKGYEHTAVADREDVDFAFDDFVNDAMGSHDQLVDCSFSWSRSNTTSLGMPLPSANSRREISMSDSSSAISSRREMGAAMVNGTRRSRAVVTMNTLMSDDAERPTSLQKDEKSRLTLSSTEIVMLAMVNLPHFACEQCVVYNKYADIAMPYLTKEAA